MNARLKDLISYLDPYTTIRGYIDLEWRMKHNPFFKPKTFKLPTDEETPFRRKDFFCNLLFECDNFFLVTDDPYSLLRLIKVWSGERVPYWQRMYDALLLDYDPLTNWDMKINEGKELKRDDNDKSNEDTKRLDKVAGYDSGELVENSQSAATRELEDIFNRQETNDLDRSEVGRKYKSAQSLVMEELQLAQVSIYDIIINEFKQKFCVLLYD